MSDYLILIVCEACGEEHYFDLESLPGGEEHCEYCEHCCARLPEIDRSDNVFIDQVR